MTSRKQDFTDISDIIYAILKGKADDREKQTFQEWLDETPENRLLYDKFKDEEYLAAKYRKYQAIDIEPNKLRFRKTLFTRKRRRMILRSCAAVLIPLIGCVGLWLLSNNVQDPIKRVVAEIKLTMPDGKVYFLNEETSEGRITGQDHIDIIHSGGSLFYENKADHPVPAEQVYSSVSIPKGRIFDLILEDGTHVWLNAESRLRFPVAFTGDDRRVFLEGEAYFEVIPDAERPFIVETGQQLLKVLGTEFNVNAYPSAQDTYTTLVTGSVSLLAHSEGDEIMLTPNQQAHLIAGSAKYAVSTVDINEVVMWREGRFAFNDQTLDQIFTILSRWYDIQYEFDGIEAANEILVGNMPVYEELDELLGIIESFGHVTIRRNGNMIKISINK